MNKTSDHDKDFFEKTMAFVTPLKRTKEKISIDRKKINYKISRDYNKEFNNDNNKLLDQIGLSKVTGISPLLYIKDGVSPKIIRQLKRGQIPCEAELDLHGETIDNARIKTEQFIANAYDRHCRSVRIIHGKGYSSQEPYPKLKNALNNWLRQMPLIIAYCSAQPKDGGTGAIYVLLKKSC